MRRQAKIELTIEERDATWCEAEAHIDGALARNTEPTPLLLKYQSVCKAAQFMESLHLAQKKIDARQASEDDAR